MTKIYQKRRQRIGGIMLLFNILFFAVYRRYERLLPESPLKIYFPVLIALLVGTTGFYFIYRISSKDQKFGIVILPITLLILFLFSLL